ncbi:hypothetical protein tinsulaeT_36680 [Thalassotalea insulae]|uniref:Zinc ribbon domain-containing protein n=1 Tax=Thalassotalea insulae TaxID=2056778 RepID=A0ABQ6GWL5_9GAMM|nr:hypothetical protein [Thalassotalea insulae]GLX80328.1 hypothetical protein tinsulaeT_36680 [Thalassotalea insulae]
MAVINCPNCRKKISDKAKSCSHCHIDLENLDEEKLANLKQIQKINKSQQIMTVSFVAMLLFCGGFLFYYWQNVQPGTWQYYFSAGSTVAGFVLYIITRIQLILLKKSNK